MKIKEISGPLKTEASETNTTIRDKAINVALGGKTAHKPRLLKFDHWGSHYELKFRPTFSFMLAIHLTWHKNAPVWKKLHHFSICFTNFRIDWRLDNTFNIFSWTRKSAPFHLNTSLTTVPTQVSYAQITPNPNIHSHILSGIKSKFKAYKTRQRAIRALKEST